MVRVQTSDFNLHDELLRLRGNRADIGAIASFIGQVRDMNDGAEVTGLALEHYPGMTEKALEAMVHEACQRWTILDATVIHRVGALKPADQIVLVMVASVHRGAAFEACEFIMDQLKVNAPFWKKELSAQGETWVGAKGSDDSAALRWNK